eukprot:1701838-Amphidinium_carterae.1
MYSERRRVLTQGAVSQPVTATHGIPPGCGHAVDLLHAFLLKTLQSAGRPVSVRKQHVLRLPASAQKPFHCKQEGEPQEDSGHLQWSDSQTTSDESLARWQVTASAHHYSGFGSGYAVGRLESSFARFTGEQQGAHCQCARSACKGASLRRSSPFEFMAYGGPAGDPQVTADLNTTRIWQRRLDAGRLDWPLEERAWTTALDRGRERGPMRHLRLLADRLGWTTRPGG